MEHDRLMQQARDKIVATARLWPDPVIRHFLQGQAALATGNGRQAEDLFKQCIDVMPTVAAFHQGRAMARAAQKRELDALDDRIAVFNLDPSNAQSFQALHDAFAAAPGNRMVAPAFARAAALLDQFEGPGGPRPQPPARPQRNQPAAPIEWPMPGTVWRSDAQSLTVPDCRSVIARKTVAVPIAADEVMCDQAAIADAAVILLEVAKGQYLKLTPVAVHPADKAADELPLAVLRAEQCQFRPVELADVTTLKVGQELKGQADSLPAELDPAGPRKFTLRVRAIEDNLPAFSGGLRPGESASPVFNADNRLVTFLASRADVMADLGGPERALAPVQVGELVTAAVKGSHASGPSHAAVTRKAGPWKVEDPVLTLHVVVMQGKP
jgi:hypothetical protein